MPPSSEDPSIFTIDSDFGYPLRFKLSIDPTNFIVSVGTDVVAYQEVFNAFDLANSIDPSLNDWIFKLPETFQTFVAIYQNPNVLPVSDSVYDPEYVYYSVLSAYVYIDIDGWEYYGNFTDTEADMFTSYSLISSPLPVALYNSTSAFVSSGVQFDSE